MGADNFLELDSVTATTTATSTTATVSAPGAGNRVVVHGFVGSSANAFGYQLKAGATVIWQGNGLAGADAGIALGGRRQGIAKQIPPNTAVTFVVTPNTGTVANMANIAFSIASPNE